jgi:hypothetical protein
VTVVAVLPWQLVDSFSSHKEDPMSGGPAASEPESSGQSMQLLLSMNDFANFKQIGKGKDCVVYAASCEKLGGHSVVLKVSHNSMQLLPNAFGYSTVLSRLQTSSIPCRSTCLLQQAS